MNQNVLVRSTRATTKSRQQGDSCHAIAIHLAVDSAVSIFWIA